MRGLPLLLTLSRLAVDGSAIALKIRLRRAMRRLAFGISAYIAGLAALGFLTAAAHRAMAEAWGNVPASLIVAGALGVLALALAYAAMPPRRARRRF